MARATHTFDKQGFTLIELLIVVAIIGVLSTIGVPTFRKMVQKAKKSEARIALGSAFTLESAFFSEYHSFGNNLYRVGFVQEGDRKQYTIGFAQADCTSIDPANILPPASSYVGSSINSVFPSYYLAGTFTSVAGRALLGSDHCLPTDVSAAYDGYTVAATGAIAPGVTSASALSLQDVWTIDQTRTLTNTNDGIP